MHEKKCDLNELFIEQFIDNELDFKESSDVSAHIENCDSCKDVYNELKFVREVIMQLKSSETLSPIEKEGFYNFIEKNSDKRSLLSRIRRFFAVNHKMTVLAASTSFIMVGLVFSFMIFNIDNSRNLIIQEIITAHNNNFPEEFMVTENNTSLAVNKLKPLAVNKKMIRELARISPELKGRYTSIAAQPMAKIKLNDKNGKGTLLMSNKNDRIKSVFENADCLVKNEDGKSCKASGYHEDGKDIVYWESDDNEYVFVSENQQLHSRMLRLINSY